MLGALRAVKERGAAVKSSCAAPGAGFLVCDITLAHTIPKRAGPGSRAGLWQKTRLVKMDLQDSTKKTLGDDVDERAAPSR